MTATEIQRLNEFSCGLLLTSDELNAMVHAINSMISKLTDLEDCCNSNLQQDSSYSTTTVLAFKGFESEAAANNDYEKQKRYQGIPNGWSSTSNVVAINNDSVLYMIQAEKRGNEWIAENSGIVWYGPYRIGSSNTTDGTGADDNEYNYIYHRDKSVLSSSNYNPGIPWIDLMNSVENNGFCNDGNSNTWTDHPQGVNENYEYEYIVGFKKKNSGWNKAFGPVIFSHYGLNGTDGDGLEYIFYLVGENNNPNITTTESYWGDRYNGYYKNNDGTITTIDHPVTIEDPDYQHDDFIPNGWHDEPQAIDNIKNKQYVSVRKKLGSLERGDQWGAFSEPKLWNVYASDGSKATLTNDTVFVDDNISSEALEIVSKTIPELWDGNNPISNFSVSINKSGNTFNNLIEVRYTDTSNVNHTFTWGGSPINIENVKEFFIKKLNSDNEPLPEGSELIIFTLTGNGKTATRVQTFLVKNFNDGEAYLLIVTPNTLGIERPDVNSNYSFRENNPLIEISAISATKGKEPVLLTLKTESLANTEGDLYVKVFDSSGLNDIPITGSSGTALTCSLSGITPMSTNVKHIQVDLYYYKTNDNRIKVDSETVDFSIKGDQGRPGNGSGSSYRIESNNRNGLIDNLTTNSESLALATELVITIYNDTNIITRNCNFNITNINLGNSLFDVYYLSGEEDSYKKITNTNLNPHTDALSIRIKLDLLNNSILEIPRGVYSYTLNVFLDGTLIGNTTFKLTVADISVDGSFYKLSIENDTIKYDSNGQILYTSSTLCPKIRIRKILNGLVVENNISVYKIRTIGEFPDYITNDSLCVELKELYNFVINSASRTSPVSFNPTYNNQSIEYKEEGYDVTLYKYKNENNVKSYQYLEGPEHIDCIKNGADGQRGSTGKMFYMMGTWNKTTRYSIDDLKIPVVYYNGKYYYLNPEIDNNSILLTPPVDEQGNLNTNNNNLNIWIEATDFGLIITEGIFGEFAKFGSGVISGDYMFSINGKVHEKKESLNDSNIINDIWTDILTDPYEYTYKKNNLNETVKAYTLFKSNDPFATNVTEINDPHFTPNWWVDLRSGEMSAAGGNFVINLDGNVTIKGGSNWDFYHNVCMYVEGGTYNPNEDSKKYYYYDNTVNDDFVRGDYAKLFKKGSYYSLTLIKSMTGGVYASAPNCFIPCSYNADIIRTIPRANLNWSNGNSEIIKLPDPEDFPYKIVEIIPFCYGINSIENCYLIGCVKDDKMAYGINRTTNNTGQILEFNTGSGNRDSIPVNCIKVSFLSICIQDEWRWVYNG